VYVHEAVLDLAPDDDVGAPGAAVTVALCGSWDHEPPCPLAAHHTNAVRDGPVVRLRVLFAAEPSVVPEVRRTIEAALRGGRLAVGDGPASQWLLRASGPGRVRGTERRQGRRLARS
jgi:hypothetical protein